MISIPAASEKSRFTLIGSAALCFFHLVLSNVCQMSSSLNWILCKVSLSWFQCGQIILYIILRPMKNNSWKIKDQKTIKIAFRSKFNYNGRWRQANKKRSSCVCESKLHTPIKPVSTKKARFFHFFSQFKIPSAVVFFNVLFKKNFRLQFLLGFWSESKSWICRLEMDFLKKQKLLDSLLKMKFHHSP